MFQVKYFMDMNRYRKWTCPPAHKTKGFWFWLVLLVVATPLFIFFRIKGFDLRMQSMASMVALVGLYRGFLVRPCMPTSSSVSCASTIIRKSATAGTAR